MPGRLPGALALAACLAATELAAAPSSARPGRFRIGPLWLTPRLELKNAGVDSNVLQSQTNVVPDTMAVLSPTLDAALFAGRRLRLTGSGYLDLNYFRRRSSERSLDFGANGRGELDVGRLTFWGEGGGSQSKQRLPVDVDERVLSQQAFASAGASLRLTRRLSLVGGGKWEDYAFGSLLVGSDDVKEVLDRISLSGELELRVGLTHKTTFVLSGAAVEDQFSSGRVFSLRRVQSSRYLAGFDFGKRALIEGSVRAGYREFPANQGAPPYRGLTLSMDVQLPLSRFGRLSGRAQRDVHYAVARFETASDRLRNTFVHSHYEAHADTELPLDFVAQGYVWFDEVRYLLPFQLDRGVLQGRVDRYWTYGGSLLKQVGARVRIGGTLALTRRSSSFRSLAFERVIYGVQAQIAP